MKTSLKTTAALVLAGSAAMVGLSACGSASAHTGTPAPASTTSAPSAQPAKTAPAAPPADETVAQKAARVESGIAAAEPSGAWDQGSQDTSPPADYSADSTSSWRADSFAVNGASVVLVYFFATPAQADHQTTAFTTAGAPAYSDGTLSIVVLSTDSSTVNAVAANH